MRGEKLAGLALALMLSLTILVGSSLAQATSIKVEPGFVSASVGETVTFNITVYNVENLNSWQLKIKYDANVLEFPPDVTEGPFLKDLGSTTFNVKPSYTYGYVEVACSLLAPVGASGSGVLASFSVKVKGGYPGYTTIDLIDTMLLDVEGAEISHTVTGGYLVIKTPVASFTYENISNYGEAYPVIVNDTENSLTSEVDIPAGVKYVFRGTVTNIGTENYTALLTNIYLTGCNETIETDWITAWWSPDGLTWSPLTVRPTDAYPADVRMTLGPPGGYRLDVNASSTTYLKVLTNHDISAGFIGKVIVFNDTDGDYDWTGEPILSEGDDPIKLELQFMWSCPYTEFFFDASESFSPLGYSIVEYTWDFNDTTIVTTTEPNITHTFSYRKEPYLVTLTVEDELGQTGSITIPIKVWRDALVVDVWPSLTWLDTVDYVLRWGQFHEDPYLANMGVGMFVMVTAVNLGSIPETITVRLEATGGSVYIYDFITEELYPAVRTITLDAESGSGWSLWFLWFPTDPATGEYLPPGKYNLTGVVDPLPCETEWGDVTNNNWTVTVEIIPSEFYLNQYEVTYWAPAEGECFGVDLYVDEVIDLYGFEFNMTWDPTLIELAEFHYEAKLNKIWGEGNWEAFVDTGPGYFHMAATALPPAEGYTAIDSPTKLVNFVFSIAYDPPYKSPGYYNTTLIEITSCDLSNSEAISIPVTVGSANYTIFASKPALEVRIPEGSVSYEANALGTVFEAQIWLVNATNVHDFWVLLEYNTTILDCLSVEINTNETWFPGPYVENWYYINDTTGIIEIYLKETLDAPTASGNGLIATIKFQVTEGITWKREIDRFLYSLLNITDFGVSVNDPILGEIYLTPPDVIDSFPGEYWFIPKVGDANLDGAVNVVDLYIVASKLGTPENVADWYDLDFSHNGLVDVYDLVIVATHIGV